MSKILLTPTMVTWIERSLRGLQIQNKITYIFSRTVKYIFPTLHRRRTVCLTSFPPNTTWIHHWNPLAQIYTTKLALKQDEHINFGQVDVFKGFPVERVLASCFVKGTADDPLDPFFKQRHSGVVTALCKALHILIAMTTGVIKKHNAAHAPQGQGAGGAKFGTDLKGANVDTFYRDVTGLVGEPHPGVSSCVCEHRMVHVCVLSGKW